MPKNWAANAVDKAAFFVVQYDCRYYYHHFGGRGRQEGGPVKWTYSKVKAYYRRVRSRAVCGECGVKGAEPGPHPDGEWGDPVRVVGADVRGVKERLRVMGWMCRSCRRMGSGAATTTTTSRVRKSFRGEVPKFPPRPSDWSYSMSYHTVEEWEAGGWREWWDTEMRQGRFRYKEPVMFREIARARELILANEREIELKNNNNNISNNKEGGEGPR